MCAPYIKRSTHFESARGVQTWRSNTPYTPFSRVWCLKYTRTLSYGELHVQRVHEFYTARTNTRVFVGRLIFRETTSIFDPLISLCWQLNTLRSVLLDFSCIVLLLIFPSGRSVCLFCVETSRKKIHFLGSDFIFGILFELEKTFQMQPKVS